MTRRESGYRHDKEPSICGSLDYTSRKFLEDFRAWLADGNGEGPLNRPPKLGPARRRLLATRLFDERLGKWGLQVDDLHANAVRERFVNLSVRLSETSLEGLLQTAESISRAEKAKATWNPKVNRKQNRRLSRTAVSAARLAQELAEIFPPPWEAERAPIGALISGLASFMKGALMATMHQSAESFLEVRNARKMLQATQRPLNKKTGMMHWQLIADLVWLASGKTRAHLSERTVRRYVEEPRQRLLGRLERDYWNRHWSDLASVERLVPISNDDPFEMAAVAYLTSLE